jgi:hypothetical protein
VNFPFICSNIPAAPAYGVYISQLIQYSRACGSYPLGTLGSLASLLAATIYQGNHDRTHKLWNIVSTERYILHMQVLLEFITRVTQRVPLVEQELLTLPVNQ